MTPSLFPNRTAHRILAVIDIGSNTSRVTVFRVDGGCHYEPMADSRAALKLLRGLSSTNGREKKATASLLAALKDFAVVARGAGAQEIVALATQSVRGYPKAQELAARIETETGIEMRIIDGQREAQLGFLGAIHSMDVEDGMLADLGGGSLEISQFKQRALVQTWSLPIGALLINDRFLKDDPPSESQIARLQDHVAEVIEQAGLPTLKRREHLVGTGGTVRNLAKMDRLEHRYPIPQLQGYTLSRRRLKVLTRQLAGTPRQQLDSLPGIKPDRKDSIVAGGLIIATLLRVLTAKQILVSGKGLREGYVLSTCMRHLPTPRQVRQAAIESLATRFSSWDRRAAQRRTGLVQVLQSTLNPEAAEDINESLQHAAWLVDIGQSIDYFNRFEHTASVLLESDLAGFSHRQIALVAAIISTARRRKFDWRVYRPLLTNRDRPDLERAGLILALADEVEKRLPPKHGIPVAYHDAERGLVGMALPVPFGGRLSALAEQFTQVFGWELKFEE
jgi:exopolyphosphatase/guanosine-5'-triphosphate,3'-diphosphate pyrophosphatase